MGELETVERLSVETPESVSFAFDLADIGSRGVAAFLDLVFLSLLILAEIAVAWLVWRGLAAANIGFAERAIIWLVAGTGVVAFVTVWGYFLVGEGGGNGRTPGKRIVGIRVVRDDGSRPGLLDVVVRNVLRLVDLLPSAYAIGVACILLTKRHKRLGDMAAGTVVVRDTGELSATFEGGDASPRTLLARDYLRRRADLTPEARRQVAEAILRAYGEEPGDWSEPVVAGRLADLAGLRETQPEDARPAADN